MAKAVKYLEGLTIHKVPYNIANTSDFKTNVMGKAADNELFIITDTPTFSLKIGNVTYDGTSNVSAIDATESASGLMSAADKIKLNGIAKGATKIKVDTSISSTSTNPVQNKVIKTELDKKADKTALDGKLDKTGGTLTGNLTGKYITGTWLQTTAATDLGYTPGKVAILDDSGWVYYRTPAEIKSDIGADAVVTTSSDGLMSASDKSKLDGIASEATKITVDTALSSNSTNPVQNKVIKSALDKKLNRSGGTLTGAITTKGIKLTSGTDFGSSLPSSLQSNQLFFQTLGSNYILDNVYPVGSIYMSVNSTNPTNLFGGTWEQIQGRFLFGMNSSYPAGSTGGEITHKLTNAEMPAHAHYMASGNSGAPDTWTPDAGSYLVDSVTDDKHTWWAQIGMNEAGGSEAHNNMPPYLSVYIWKRTK